MNFIEVGCNTFVTFCTVINAKPDSAQLCKGNQHFVHSAMHTVQCTHNSSKAQRGGGLATRSREMPLFMTFCVDVEYHRFVAVVQSTTNRLNKLDANLAHWPSAVSDCSWMGKSRLCPAEESGGVGATNLVVRRNWLGALHDSSWIGKRRRRLSRWRCHIAQLHSCSCTVATLHSCRVASLHSIVKLTSQCIALLYFTCRNFFALSCLLKPCYNKIS